MVLAKLTIITFLIADLYKDGYWKRTGKLLYSLKWVMYLSVLMFGFFAYPYLYDWELYVSVLLLKKPISDIAYAYGYKKQWFYIGNTNWSDKIMHKLGLVRLQETKFPIIAFIYLLMIFIGVLL